MMTANSTKLMTKTQMKQKPNSHLNYLFIQKSACFKLKVANCLRIHRQKIQQQISSIKCLISDSSFKAESKLLAFKHNKINKSFKKKSKLSRHSLIQHEVHNQVQVNITCKVIRKIVRNWLRTTLLTSFTASLSYPKQVSDYLNSIRSRNQLSNANFKKKLKRHKNSLSNLSLLLKNEDNRLMNYREVL